MDDETMQERAKKRAQDIGRKALLEAEKDLIPTMSYSEKKAAESQIKTYNEKLNRKERKRTEKEMRHNLSKPIILVSLAGVFSKILHIIVTIYTMAMVVNLFFIWQIYKAISAVGWLSIFKTEYSLYVVIYFAFFFILKAVYFQLHKYANT
jgi:hypothetical protein